MSTKPMQKVLNNMVFCGVAHLEVISPNNMKMAVILGSMVYGKQTISGSGITSTKLNRMISYIKQLIALKRVKTY